MTFGPERPEYIDREERASRGTVLGYAIWRRLAEAAGLDPKDETRGDERDAFVEAVRQAFVALEGGGFEGIEEWNRLEHMFDTYDERGGNDGSHDHDV